MHVQGPRWPWLAARHAFGYRLPLTSGSLLSAALAPLPAGRYDGEARGEVRLTSEYTRARFATCCRACPPA
eukprot:4304543-Prymnesium_polylepis.1